MVLNPLVNIVGIEADKLAHFEERDAALSDQSPNEALRYAESFGKVGNVD